MKTCILIKCFAVFFVWCTNVYGQKNTLETGSEPSVYSQNNVADSTNVSFWENMDIKLKINAAYAQMSIANMGIEFKINKKFSLDFPVLYSPYNLSSKKKIRILAFQPEFRYWLNQQYDKHFIGIHTHIAWFNTAGILDGDKRYQDSGDKPLWGAGISYGYVLQMTDWLDVEFTLGLGYARIYYDTYYNVKNGQRFEYNQTKNYFGITRLGVSFSYKF